MYGYPPDPRPATTLSPASAEDLQVLLAHARRQRHLLCAKASTAGTPHEKRICVNDLAVWGRIEAWAQSAIDGAEMIVRHRMPSHWREVFSSLPFWVGVFAGFAFGGALVLVH